MTPSASAGKSLFQLFRSRYTMHSPYFNIIFAAVYRIATTLLDKIMLTITEHVDS